MLERAPALPDELLNVRVTMGPDGVITIDFHDCDRVTLPVVQEAHARHLALCADRKVPVLMLGHQVSGVDYDAQRFGSTPSVSRAISALALVVHSFLERHLARLFLMYHRPPYPVRVFDDESAARRWLARFNDSR